MSITDELRKIAAKTECASGRCEKLYRGDLDHAADRIDERIEREYVKAPVDADGVPWHLGDKVDGMVGSITYLSLGYIGWQFRLGDAYTFQCEKYRHHHAPTVEDVLRECIANVCKSNAQLHDQGCPPLTMEDIDEEPDEFINEYVERLRLAEEAE